MRIVLLNQFFWPDAIATGQFLTDLARQLARKHEVFVVCGKPAVSSPDNGGDVPPAVVILRTRNIGFSHRKTSRIASYISYLAGTLWHGLRIRRPSAIVTLTTPPLLSIVGSLLSRFHRTRHFIWEMDIYPDVANDLGYFTKYGIADRVTGFCLDWARERATAIIVLGADMKARLIARGIPDTKIHIAENWANGEEITPHPFRPGPLVVHYSGNLGLAHDTDTILGVIGRLRNQSSFQFIFAGGGPQRQVVEEYCRSNHVENVEFRPYCSRAELGQSLAEGHLGLVTQLPQTLGSIVPSKIYGIMAAGRPLLYIGPDRSTPAQHILRYNCGWRVEPGDVGELERLLIHLSGNRHLLSEAGSRARAAFEQTFTRAIGVSRIESVLESLSLTVRST
jgi:colanic acid biosynthesis glycosyl transferase WcaI